MVAFHQGRRHQGGVALIAGSNRWSRLRRMGPPTGAASIIMVGRQYLRLRWARSQGVDTKIATASIASRKRRFCITTAISAICVIGAVTTGSSVALAQAPGSVGSRCNVNSDCSSNVCHPVTHLCMISPAAAQPPKASSDINSHNGRSGNESSGRSMPKASGRPVGATCNVDSDCGSGVCHPITHLCMISPAAARP